MEITIGMNGVAVPIVLDGEALAAIAARVPVHPTVASPYMTVPEAAEFLRCSRQRIYDLLSARRLSRFKDGSRTLVARADLERYVQEAR